MAKVFIDGASGTTGLRIFERLENRQDIELIKLSDELRKDEAARKEAMNSADVVFLCLPDAAAIEAVKLVTNPETTIIDASTAHRTAAGWTYGFPELIGKEKIKAAKRIANPGCHASGFISLIKPLIDAGVLKKDANLSCFSLTGYSGGGKKMIQEYESPERPEIFKGPRQYGLTQQHKHLNEMQIITGLDVKPAFCPIVGDFYSGMEVTVPVFAKDLCGSVTDVIEAYKKCYNNSLVFFKENADESGYLSASVMAGRDDMEISVYGNEERLLLVSRFDNLGKGASGAAVQNMNLVIGADEYTGLVIA